MYFLPPLIIDREFDSSLILRFDLETRWAPWIANVTFTNGELIQHIGPGIYRCEVVLKSHQGRPAYRYIVDKIIHWETIMERGE